MNVQDVKAAEAIAVTYLRDLYSDERLTHICLDDVWLSDDEKYWYDTIGDDAPTSASARKTGAFRKVPWVRSSRGPTWYQTIPRSPRLIDLSL